MNTNFFAKLARRGQVALSGLRRHAIAAGVGGALIAAGAGGGIGYAMSQPSSPQAASTVAAASASQATPGPKTVPARRPRRLALGALIGLVARNTHQTRAQVLAQLRAGKSLDQIAGSQASSIQQTVTSKLQGRLAAAVKAGRITQAQADKRLAAWKTRLQKIMSTPGTSLPFVSHRGRAPRSTTAPAAA